MSELLAYLSAQARMQPASTLRFVAGEVWRRGRARLHPRLGAHARELAAADFQQAVPLFLPAMNLAQQLADDAPWVAAALERAERALQGNVEVFGEWTRAGLDPDWQLDWKSGHRWPLAAAGRLRVLDAPPGADVKRPWEVARFHQGLALGAGAALTREEKYARAFEKLARHWIEHNPWPRGIHWAMPMEAALRAINWIQAAVMVAAAGLLGDEFARELSRSLFLHGRHLWAYREWNPVARANHYLSCVAGLLWLGVLFEGTPEGRQWLEFARSELSNEIMCQTGPDGVAHEGSSGYHAFVAELFLSCALVLARREARGRHAENGVAEAIEEATSREFRERLENLFDFPAALCAGRDEPPVWGDSDDGRVLPFGGASEPPVSISAALGAALDGEAACPQTSPAVGGEVFWRFGRLPRRPSAAAQVRAHRSQAFRDSGFFFFSGRRMRGSLRCGPLGVHGWANHAHNDQLSCEFSLDGSPVLVDPGLPCYSDDPAARNLFRSTRYHNTVVVAGAEQNRFWPALLFRIVDDARSRVERWQAEGNRTIFAGSHSGYLRLPERVAVRREITLGEDDTLTLHDVLDAAKPVPLAWYFHFAPGIVPVKAPEGCRIAGRVTAGMSLHSQWLAGPVLLSVWTGCGPGELDARTSEGWMAPRFGQKHAASVLEFHGSANPCIRASFTFTPAGAAEETREPW